MVDLALDIAERLHEMNLAKQVMCIAGIAFAMAVFVFCTIAGSVGLLWVIDRRFATRIRVNGVVKKKFLSIPKGDEYEFILDSPTDRKIPGVRFMITINCGSKDFVDGLIFEWCVDELSFDSLRVGDTFPAIYERGKISGNPRLLGVSIRQKPE